MVEYAPFLLEGNGETDSQVKFARERSLLSNGTVKSRKSNITLLSEAAFEWARAQKTAVGSNPAPGTKFRSCVILFSVIGKEKYFWSYVSAMADLNISRRTLQRWLDDLDIKSLEFENHLKVFLTLPHMVSLREYGQFMRTRNQPLIERYRAALDTGNTRRLSRLRKELAEIKTRDCKRIED